MSATSREPAARGSQCRMDGRATDASMLSAGPHLSTDARVALAERARRGDRDAFEALVSRWVEPAFRTAMAILGDEADARDATQDALLHAWRGIRGLHDEERFDAWLGRIHANACRSIGRRRKRARVREIPIERLGIGDDPPTPGASVDDSATALDELERAFGRLSVDHRTLLALHHLDHRPVASLAQILGVPEGTVKWRLHAAREALARALEEERR